MFDQVDKSKDLREKLLEQLIDHIMSQPDGDSKAEEKAESPLTEMLEGKDGEADELDHSEGDKPKIDLSIMSVKAKPKFKLADGTEQEDESLEDIMKRKGLK